MYSKILPEACCDTRKYFSYEECVVSYKENQTVCGTVVSYNNEEEYVTVRLGYELFAKLPYSEVSIYPLKYSTNPEYKLPFQVCSILNKKISAKILLVKGDEIILSRKSNMLEAFEQLKNHTYLRFYVTSVTQSDVFGDVGAGISARIPRCKLCKSRIRSAEEIVCVGSNLLVKAISCDYENIRFTVSYKDTFDNYNPDLYYSGEKITCIVNEVVDDTVSGYFVNVTPQVVGIVDNLYGMPKLNYGDKIDCIITRATKKGLHLKFCNFSNKVF